MPVNRTTPVLAAIALSLLPLSGQAELAVAAAPPQPAAAAPSAGAGATAQVPQSAALEAQPGAMAEPTPAPSGIGVDSSQVLAVSAGVIGGTLVAGLLAEGLIVPIYCWATGSGGAAGAGAGAGLIHGVIRTVGAVGGGLYGNAWYRSHGEAATAVAQ